jgi:hypothetical protein
MTYLIGLRVRVVRCGEILREITAWISTAEDLVKPTSDIFPL